MREEQEGRNRLCGLDWIRSAAAFMVVLLHTSGIQFVEYEGSWGGVGAFYDSLTRCSVPLFFMITGYFLLTGKKESIAVFIRRRFLRVFLPFLMLGFVYAIWKGWDFKELIKAMFIHGPMDYHLWYVYYIIGIYLVIPFLNPIFQLENKKIIEYYIVIWFISFIFFQTITGVFNFYWNPFVTFNFYYFQGFLGYVVLGGLLRILFEELNNKQISNIRSFTWINLTLFIFNGFLIFGCTYYFSMKENKPVQLFFEYSNLFVFLQSLTFFCGCYYIKLLPRLVYVISKYSYWVYLLHILCLQLVLKKISIVENSILTIPVASLLTFMLAFFMSIPLLKIENFIVEKMRRCF